MFARSSKRHLLATFIGATAMAGSVAFAQQPPSPASPPPSAAQPAPAPGQPNPQDQSRARDRAAFLDARIAAVKAGLALTPDQAKLWPPLEQAVRDGLAKRAALREAMRSSPPPADMFERMRRMADRATERGASLRAFVDAAQPFYTSLSDEQKHRLPMLLHRDGPERFGAMSGAQGREGGSGRGFEHEREYGGRDGVDGRFGMERGRGGPGEQQRGMAEAERGFGGWGENQQGGPERGGRFERDGEYGRRGRDRGPQADRDEDSMTFGRSNRRDYRSEEDFSDRRWNQDDRAPF